MLKKIFCIIVVLAALVGNASAAEVPIETYSSRVKCYVLTETFVNRTQYRDNRAFSVDVKFVGAATLVNNYSFRENDGLIWLSVNGEEDGVANNDELAKRIWNFGLKYLGMDYEVRYD